MKVIILRGISGSGKTTLAIALMEAQCVKTLVVSADQYWMRDGEYKFNAAELSEAHEDCLIRYLHQLGLWATVTAYDPLLIVDNTNTRGVEIAPYYQLAAAHGARVSLVTIICDPRLAWESNVHGTPNKHVWAQHQRILSEEIPPWWEHLICFRAHEAQGRNLSLDPGVILESLNEPKEEA